MSVPNPCSIVNSVLEYENQLLSAVMGKFNSLERLVQLIYEMGSSVLRAVPRLSDWIPVAEIDLSIYERLRAACPMLGLPPADLESLEELRAEVEDAYMNFFYEFYSNHPWCQIEYYRSEANKYLNDAYGALGRDWLACASFVCHTVDGVIAGDAVRLNDKFSALISGNFDWLTQDQRAAYHDFRVQRDYVGDLFQSESRKSEWEQFFPRQLTTSTPVVDPVR
jgi:hypothetical protein